MSTSTTPLDGLRVAALVALGLEFARSHSIKYASALIKEMGADERTVALLNERYLADRPSSNAAGVA